MVLPVTAAPTPKPRPIAADNPNTSNILVRVNPATLQALDGWLHEINTTVVGPRWSRTDLLRVAIDYLARTRPNLLAPPRPDAHNPGLPTAADPRSVTPTVQAATVLPAAKAPKSKPAATNHKALVARFKQSGMSRRELADLAKVPVGSMSGWLAGRTKYDRAIDKALRAKGH